MSLTGSSYILPDWPAPANVGAVITTRLGGASPSPYESFNLAPHVGDSDEKVFLNRQKLVSDSGQSRWSWLRQVHGTTAINLDDAECPEYEADASFSRRPGDVCVVMTADCLPLLVCDKRGKQIASIHAGWRGLGSGIISETLKQFDASASDLLVYLGPAIGPDRFEVGQDVLDLFEEYAGKIGSNLPTEAFSLVDGKDAHFLADLYTLARWQLNVLGVQSIYGGKFCTYTQKDLFYSYRRDGVCGRMASAIWKVS